MEELELRGCPFQPLGAYLKALAVLRLMTQEDGEARGYWNSRCFVLRTKLGQEELIEFFLERYEPTSVLSPWNGGSGFYPKDRKTGIDAIRASNEDRFATYRRDLGRAAEIVAEVGKMPDEDSRRSEILRRCRNELSDACVEWLDAAIAIAADESRAFAPILGTGGNEGRLDYTNNFMENLNRLFISPEKKFPVRTLLENALFGTLTDGLQDIAVGQYDPGRAGGFNQSNGIEADSVANPWNAVLTLEGAIAWAGGIYRKQGVAYRSFLCSPFTVRPTAAGYGSASEKDEETARAEVWTPIWNNPARFEEIRMLLREGRAAVGGKAAQNGLQFAEAAASLGVDRGIDAFIRYNLVKRRGDSYLALPAGKFPVEYRSTADLIREMTPLLDQAKYAAKGNNGEVPNSWPPLMRAVEEAMFQALLHGRKHLVVEVASAFGAIHRWLLERKREVNWRGRLSENWVRECCEVKAEARLAAALAGLGRKNDPDLVFNVNPAHPRFSWAGRDLTARMLSTLRRRTLDGAQSDESPFRSSMAARATDVATFLERRIDDELMENLVFAFLLCKPAELPAKLDGDGYQRWPGYCVLKQFFAFSTHPRTNASADEPQFRPDLSMTTYLTGNKVKDAVESGIRRLRNAGLETKIRTGWDTEDGLRLGAALLIPVWDVERLRKWIAEDSVLEERES